MVKGGKVKVGAGRRELEYRVVYIGIRNSVVWDSERRHVFIVTNSAVKLLMRLAVGGTTVGDDVSEYVHWTELAGGNTVKYMYELRQQLGDRGVSESNGEGWWRLGPGRGVRVCSHAWNELGPPDADFSKLVGRLDHCQDVDGHWDDRRMMEVRFRMRGRAVVSLGCGGQFTRAEMERLELRPGSDVRPRVRRRKIAGTGEDVGVADEAKKVAVVAGGSDRPVPARGVPTVAPVATSGIGDGSVHQGVGRIPRKGGVAPGVPAISSGE